MQDSMLSCLFLTASETNIFNLLLFDNLPTFLQVTKFLNRMQLHAKLSTSDNKQCNFVVSVPPSRSDVLHPCDVMEVLIVTDSVIPECILDLLCHCVYISLTRHAFFILVFFNL